MVFGAASFAVLAGPAQLVGAPAVPLLGIPAGLLVGSLAGLLPDLDEPGALLARGTWLPRAFGWPLRMLIRLISIPLRLLGMVLKGVLGHRGGTHSIAMCIIFSLALAFPITILLGAGGDWLIWTVVFGFLSHLIADSLNPSGVPWFWPLQSKHQTHHLLPKMLRVPTESPPNAREMFIRLWMALAAIALIVLFCILPALSNI
jgi:membrane-bound metal-dependent hydrolase YbcI (DUF457 family)